MPKGLKFTTATFKPEDYGIKSIYLPKGVKTKDVGFTYPNVFNFANAKSQADAAVKQGKQDRAREKAKEQAAKNHYKTREAAMKKASAKFKRIKDAEDKLVLKAEQAEEKKAKDNQKLAGYANPKASGRGSGSGSGSGWKQDPSMDGPSKKKAKHMKKKMDAKKCESWCSDKSLDKMPWSERCSWVTNVCGEKGAPTPCMWEPCSKCAKCNA